MTTSPIERAAETFAAELALWRVERGLSKKQLAARMGFDPSYVSHVEGRRHKPTEDFARRAEAVLGAGGMIWQRFQEYDELRHARSSAVHRDPHDPSGSNRHHREHPLTFSEIDLEALAGEGDAVERMQWRVKIDRD